jgi:hypothetical protein
LNQNGGPLDSILSPRVSDDDFFNSLLVHGARAVVRTAPSKTDPSNMWVNQLRERRGFNRATVAVASKNARIIWAVLRTGEPYRAAF